MIIAFLATIVAAADPPPVPDYVPDIGWEDGEWAGDFHEEWFGRQLAAMHEPSLATPADLAGMPHRFRLLVLPTFKPAFAYRVDLHADGTATLRAVRLDGRGGCSPGKVAAEVQRPIQPGELSAFLAAVDRAELSSRQRQDAPSHVSSDPAGMQVITICTDGTAYVVEALDREGRQFVTRRCSVEEGLEQLVEAYFALNPPPEGWE